MESFIYFRDCQIPYISEYNKYELLKNFSNDYGAIILTEYDSTTFINLCKNNTLEYNIETWKLAHFIGAPKNDLIAIVKKIAETLSYGGIPELCKDELFLK